MCGDRNGTAQTPHAMLGPTPGRLPNRAIFFFVMGLHTGTSRTPVCCGWRGDEVRQAYVRTHAGLTNLLISSLDCGNTKDLRVMLD
jgi:hypothetical protein